MGGRVMYGDPAPVQPSQRPSVSWAMAKAARGLHSAMMSPPLKVIRIDRAVEIGRGSSSLDAEPSGVTRG